MHFGVRWAFSLCAQRCLPELPLATHAALMSRGMGTFSPLCDAAEAQAVPSGPTRPQSCRAGRRGTQAHSLRRQRTQHLRATLSATLPAPSGARAPSAELWSLQLHDTGATFAAALPQDRDCPSPVDTAFDVPPWLASEADGQPVPPPPSGGDPEGNQYYLQARQRQGTCPACTRPLTLQTLTRPFVPASSVCALCAVWSGHPNSPRRVPSRLQPRLEFRYLPRRLGVHRRGRLPAGRAGAGGG